MYRSPERRETGRPAAPTIVLLHGGSWSWPYNRWVMWLLARDVTRRGWGLFNVDYRRVGRFGGGGGWPETLRRCPGCHRVDHQRHVGAGHRCRSSRGRRAFRWRPPGPHRVSDRKHCSGARCVDGWSHRSRTHVVERLPAGPGPHRSRSGIQPVVKHVANPHASARCTDPLRPRRGRHHGAPEALDCIRRGGAVRRRRSGSGAGARRNAQGRAEADFGDLGGGGQRDS